MTTIREAWSNLLTLRQRYGKKSYLIAFVIGFVAYDIVAVIFYSLSHFDFVTFNNFGVLWKDILAGLSFITCFFLMWFVLYAKVFYELMGQFVNQGDVKRIDSSPVLGQKTSEKTRSSI